MEIRGRRGNGWEREPQSRHSADTSSLGVRRICAAGCE